MRVHQVAKEFNISSEALVELLRGMGVDVKSHMSTVDEQTVEKVKQHFEAEREKLKEEAARKEKELARRREQRAPEPEVKPKPKKPLPKGGAPPREEEENVASSVKRVMATMEGAKKKKRRRRDQEEELEDEQAARVITLEEETLSPAELAKIMKLPLAEVIKACMGLGVMASANQKLDADTVEAVADELGFQVVRPSVEEEVLEEEAEAEPRPPVVTVMGHVDHGKTSLLDAIRKTNVADREEGGITQSIGASEVVTPDGTITFIDTPGHEAFTTMRARGAQVTDIVVLVVSAVEGVKPQTVEAINHAKAAQVPLIVAIHKVDLPDANPDRVRKELADHGVVVEAWGGSTMDVCTSARTGKGIKELLEKILFLADLMELKAPRTGRATAVVLEAALDPGLGRVATVIVKSGTLRVGDPFVVGPHWGRVRVLKDDKGRNVQEAPPSKAVRVASIEGIPLPGDILQVTADERTAREMAERRQKLRQQQGTVARRATLEDLYRQIRQEETKELRIVLRADCQGTLEAVSEAIRRLDRKDVRVHLLHEGVGAVTENDVMLASASDGLIVGFRVRPTAGAMELAEREGVEVRTYRVIYECLDDVQRAMEGLLKPQVAEVVIGRISVRRVFRHPKAGVVAGCLVLEGSVDRSSRIRVIRDGTIVFDSRVASLKRFKDDVREVQAGYECGLVIEGFRDVREGDILEAYKHQEVAKV